MVWKIACLPCGVTSNMSIVVSSLIHQMAVAPFYVNKGTSQRCSDQCVSQVIKKRNVSLKILQERKPNTKQVIISISLKYKILPSKHQRKRSTNAIGLLEWVACLIPIPKNHSDTTHLLLNTLETVSCLSIPFMHLAYEKQDRGD